MNTIAMAVNQLKAEHYRFSLMIDELDQAVANFDGADLVNSIDLIYQKYGMAI